MIEHILGFRKYLLAVEDDKLKKILREDPTYFEKILPFAIALNIGNHRIKKCIKILDEINYKLVWADCDDILLIKYDFEIVFHQPFILIIILVVVDQIGIDDLVQTGDHHLEVADDDIVDDDEADEDDEAGKIINCCKNFYFLETYAMNFDISIKGIIGIIIIVFTIFVFVYSIYHERKLKKLKYEGIGVLKRTKIINAKRRYISGDEDTSGYYEYWLESKDDLGEVYRSNSYRNLKYGGRTIEEMKRIYNGVAYDLSNKETAIKQINDKILFIESELANNPGFFKKMKLKNELKSMKEYLNIANEGPIPPYLIINGHKISVGDTVDVYVDPNATREYYFDLDFTKEKAIN